MKLLYSTEYFGRVFYVLEVNDKVLMIYKSSGLSGTGHKGRILPFMFICTRRTIREPLGYIYKEMYYDKEYISHHKDLTNFGIQDKIEKITKFIENIKVPITSPDIPTQEYIDYIYENLSKATSGKEMFDFKLDFIQN